MKLYSLFDNRTTVSLFIYYIIIASYLLYFDPLPYANYLRY